jgi:CRISPR-associated protein Cas1
MPWIKTGGLAAFGGFGMPAVNGSVPDLAPARMVNEYVYCPRLAYLEWVQSDFAVNYEVAEGRYCHRVVDEEGGELPEVPGEGETIHARSVWLSAPEERLTARIDLVEGEGNALTPVDYKRGTVPDNSERSWPADRVQLCAQGLVLSANGYECSKGVLYYVESKTRVEIAFDDELIRQTREAVNGIFAMAATGKIPPPLAESAKCVRCSLAGICLPDEINMLAGGEGPHEGEPRRIVPARGDSLPLYVQEQGARISCNGELFEVQKKRDKLGEARIFETSHVCLFGNVQVTTQALREMCVRGIPLSLFSSGGWFYGMASGMTHKNVELRMHQYRAASDRTVSCPIAAAMIAAKIDNCRTLLMRNHPQLPVEQAAELKLLAEATRKAPNLESLLGVEGMAARVYFAHFSGMLKGSGSGEWGFDFQGRNRRPPRDPVNAMLSYAYSLLVKEVAVTALAVGFDPFLGLYHQPRYGRPSLALDLMEEFRPIVADSIVLGVVNNGVLTPEDFIRRGTAVALTPAARKKFISAYERRMDVLITHPLFGYKISYRRVLEVQCRLLGRTLSGELKEYPAFRTR